METAKKTKGKKKAAATTEESLKTAYRNYLLMEGKRPSSVYKFCFDLGIQEADFYVFFGSFEALEKSIWKHYADDVISRLQSDSNYGGFSAREKILAFYYTLTESLKEDRSFVLHQLHDLKNPALLPGFLKVFKKEFDLWINAVLNEGKATGEIAKRPYLDTRYDSLFWLHMMFILQFWCHDDSPGFEKTDMAIEKSVNLAFDLVGKGVLDNALDFGKFLYQNSKN